MDLTSCKQEDGRTIRFWKDEWRDISPAVAYPHLFSFARQQDINLKQLLSINDRNLLEHFHLPLSMVAFQQSESVSAEFTNFSTSIAPDRWVLRNEAKFSVQKVYAALAPVTQAPAPFLWIWKSCVQLKHNFFFWLLLQDRLNTRDLLTRKTFYLEDTACVLYSDDLMEYMQHLFFGCDFSQSFWWRLNQEWNYDLGLYEMLLDGYGRSGHSCFKECLIIGCWSLWNNRNTLIFDNGHLRIDICISLFREFFSLVMHKAKPSLQEGMQQWLDAM